jgi:RNA polymerase sigma factor (sigma-70 family)
MTLTMSRTSRPPVCSEQELVAATRAGDDRAFEELYARYRDRISGFILSRVHDHGRAEDIAQEVFMSALRRLRGTDRAIAFKPWIYEIAKNACIDEFRRGSRAREVPLESDGEFVVDHQGAGLSSVPTPPAAVESKQRLNDLRGAFGGLSASHHQLLVMREFEGLSYDEIGSRLDMSRQMVDSSLFRARRKLSEEYQELASGQRCEQIQTAIDGGRLRSVTSLGLRDRRRFARHLSHCQPCRHAALMAGVDETLVKPRTSIAAKIAALLPFPAWRLSRRSHGTKAANGSHQMAGAGSAGLGSAGSAFTLGQAAATVAVVIAGAGGGLAVNSIASGGHHRAPGTVNAADRTRQGASAASSAAVAKAAHVRGAATSHRSAAIRVGSSAATTPQPGAKRRHRTSASGGAGSGGGGTTNSTGSGSGATAAGTAANAVKKTANNLASGAGKTLNGVTSGVGKTVGGVTNGVSKTLNGVTSGVGKTVNGVASGVGNTVNGAVGGVGNAVNTVTQATGTATTPVGQAVSGATGTVGQAVGGATNGVTQTTGGVTSGVGKTVSGVTGSVSTTVNGVTGLSGAGTGTTGAVPHASGTTSAPSTAQSAVSAVQPAGSLLGK